MREKGRLGGFVDDRNLRQIIDIALIEKRPSSSLLLRVAKYSAPTPLTDTLTSLSPTRMVELVVSDGVAATT